MLATQTEVSDGTLTAVSVGIEFFNQTDISVSLDLSSDPLVSGVDYYWSNATTIQFNNTANTPGALVPNGVEVIIRRDTKSDEMFNVYDGGAPFSRLTLDENFEQLLFLSQEFSEGLGLDGLRNHLDMNGYRIEELGDPIQGTDAANKDYVDTSMARAIRVPDNETVAPLASAISRANKVLGFNASGDPVAIVPASGSAADLALDLANSADTSLGVAMLGYNGQTLRAFLEALNAGDVEYSTLLTYPAGSVGAAMRKLETGYAMRNINTFGTFVGDGIANDLASYQAAAASGPGIIDCRGTTSLVNGTWTPGANQLWLMAGTRINTGSNTSACLFMLHSHQTSILGPLEFHGPGKAVGTQRAVQIESSRSYSVMYVKCFDIPGHGFYLSGNDGTTTRHDGGDLGWIGGFNCYKGYEDIPGSEYGTVDNPRFTGCSLWGMKTCAGNVRINNPQILDNDLDGVIVVGGSNHAHGGIVGGNINHNPQYNLYCNGVTNGFQVTGTNFYGNGGATGAIAFIACGGVVVSNGHLDVGTIYDFDPVAANVVHDMYCPGSYGVMIVDSRIAGVQQRTSTWVYNLTGPGAVNVGGVTSNGMPGRVAANVQRLAGSTQALSSGVSTTLTFPAVVMNSHGAQNVGSGVFTVPAGQGGLYRIEADLVFTAPSYSAANSYVELLKGSTAYTLVTSPNGFNSNVLTYQIRAEDFFVAGDTISIKAVISASGPSFGHVSYRSSFRVTRIA